MKKILLNFFVLFVTLAWINQASAQIIFDAYFENGNTSEVDSEHEVPPGSTDVVANPLVNADNPSSQVVRYRTTGSSERAEIRVKYTDVSAEFWYGWQIYIPTNWMPARPAGGGGGHDIIQQWHRGNTDAPYTWAKGHPMTLNISDDGSYNFAWNYGGGATPRIEMNQKLTGINANTDKGKWIHWALHANWVKEGTSGGFLRLYHNGVLVLTYDGPTWENMPWYNMWKAGMYHGDASTLDQDPYDIYGDNYILAGPGSDITTVNPNLPVTGICPNPGTYNVGGDSYAVSSLDCDDLSESGWTDRWFIEKGTNATASIVGEKLRLNSTGDGICAFYTGYNNGEFPKDFLVKFNATATNLGSLSLIYAASHVRNSTGTEYILGTYSGDDSDYNNNTQSYRFTFDNAKIALKTNPGRVNMPGGGENSAYTVQLNQEYEVVMAVYDGSVRLYLDGVRIFDATDNTNYPGGKFYVRTRNASIDYDNFEFYEIGGSTTPPNMAAINCGGSAFTASDGTQYSADVNFSGGSTYSTSDATAGTTDDVLYQSERFNNFSYAIPLENGTYDVTLKFAEIYFTSNGSRTFNVSLEGTQVINNLDIHAQVGHDAAYDETHEVTVSDGTLNIQFSNVTNNAKVAAILVEPGGTIIPVTGVSLSGCPASVLTAGGTASLSATVSPSDATDQSVSWSSSNTAVATVAANGLVTAQAPGTATITVSTNDGGFTDNCVITVDPIAVTGVSIDNCPASDLNIGSTVDLNATISPSDATDQSVSWSSNNTGVASVDANGVVTANAAGSATITVTTNDGGFTDNCVITVPETPVFTACQQIEAEAYNSMLGIQTQATSDVGGGDNVGWIENGDWIMFSDVNFGCNPDEFQARVASATSGGNIELRLDATNGTLIGTCAVSGTTEWQTWATVSCPVSGASGTHDLYLVFTGGSGYLFNINYFEFIAGTPAIPVTGVTLSGCPTSMLPGGTASLSATVSPSDATDQTVSWSSSNSSVATVDANGLVTAQAVGTATITVTTNDGGFTDNCAITVDPIAVTGVSIDNCPASALNVGGSVGLNATVSPANATDQSVSWSSSNTSVATVDASGNVSAIAEGSATITVTTNDGGFTDDCAITVNPAPSDELPWIEDFAGIANGVTSDAGATAWSATRPSGSFEVNAERFWVNGSGEEGVWTSEAIPTGGASVDISIDVDDGDDTKETADYVRASYIVDGGSEVQFGEVTEDINPTTFTATGISTSSSIEIIVRMNVSWTSEHYYIDNISVTSAGAKAVPSTLSLDKINVYPVPCSVCNLEVGSEWIGGQINVTDLVGKLIYSGEVYEKNQVIELSGRHSGFAIIKLEKNGNSIINKIIVE